MRINYDAILDGCAMAGVLIPVMDIDKMLLGKKPMASSVAKIIVKLAKQEKVKPVLDEPLKTRSSARKYMDRKEDILALLQNTNLRASDMALSMGLDSSQVNRILNAIHKDGLIDYIQHPQGSRDWFITGHAPDMTDYTVYRDRRNAARETGLVIYDGRPCDKCGGSEIYVNSNKCKPCLKIYRNEYLKTY